MARVGSQRHSKKNMSLIHVKNCTIFEQLTQLILQPIPCRPKSKNYKLNVHNFKINLFQIPLYVKVTRFPYQVNSIFASFQRGLRLNIVPDTCYPCSNFLIFLIAFINMQVEQVKFNHDRFFQHYF